MAPRTSTKQKAASIVGGLTEEERAALLEELTERPEAATVHKLSPRERVIGALLRERDHLDGCPVFESELGGARTEAYDAVKPANPNRGEPARDVAVLRCLECGGTRYMHDTTVLELLRRELEAPVVEADEGLDGTI